MFENNGSYFWFCWFLLYYRLMKQENSHLKFKVWTLEDSSVLAIAEDFEWHTASIYQKPWIIIIITNITTTLKKKQLQLLLIN